MSENKGKNKAIPSCVVLAPTGHADITQIKERSGNILGKNNSLHIRVALHHLATRDSDEIVRAVNAYQARLGAGLGGDSVETEGAA